MTHSDTFKLATTFIGWSGLMVQWAMFIWVRRDPDHLELIAFSFGMAVIMTVVALTVTASVWL